MPRDPKLYQVNEIFSTIQGEGHWMGVPATFVRLQGCSVGCPWCDTKYTWYGGGSPMFVDDIIAQVRHHHVVITGGEPTIWNLDELVYAIHHFVDTPMGEAFVQVESSGQKDFKGNIPIDWVTWSPKRNLKFEAPEGFRMLVDEIKFVVDEDLTFNDVEHVLDQMKHSIGDLFKTLTFMAEGCPPTPYSLKRTMEFAREYEGVVPRVMACDRLQYRMEVK